MSKRGILVVVSGFSGAGKGTIMKALLQKYYSYALSISATTRDPRPGEEDKREYFFVTKEKFESMIENHELIEHAKYVDNYYGTPKQYVEEQLSQGKNVILEIEIQGALIIKQKFQEAFLVFVMPPSASELKKRLIGRGTETKEVIEYRMRRALEEAQGIEKYDCLVINDNLEECVSALHDTIQVASHTPSRNKEFIKEMKKELEEISKGEI